MLQFYKLTFAITTGSLPMQAVSLCGFLVEGKWSQHQQRNHHTVYFSVCSTKLLKSLAYHSIFEEAAVFIFSHEGLTELIN